jgi:CubicO group peptidase (beta-lactamase class C family)
MLLKGIIERVAGAAWQTVLAARVLGPLGLACTTGTTAIDDLRAVVPVCSAAAETDGLSHGIHRQYYPGWVAHVVVGSTPRGTVAF